MLSEKEVAENIKRYRRLSGFSCEEIGKKLNISRQRVSFIENNPFGQKAETLMKYADLYGVPVCFFFMPLEVAKRNYGLFK